MKSRTTVFLIVALTACVAYVAICRRGFFAHPEPKPIPKKRQALFSEPPGKPVELTVVSRAGGKMIFRADGTGWRIVEPIEAAAIDDRIRAIVDTLVSMTCLQHYEPADPNAPDTTVTGLDSPRWTVTLTDDMRRTRGLEIGLPVPLSGKTRTYVRASGDKRICISSGNPAGTMSHPVSYYRSPRVLAIPPDAIMSVRVAGAETYGIYRKVGQDQWRIKPGGDYKDELPADKREIETFLELFARIDAREFVDDKPADLAPYGLNAGSERLTLTIAFLAPGTDNAKTRTLTLGLKTGDAGTGKVFAKLADRQTVFTLPASMVEDLQPSTLKLRDKTVLPITAETAGKIELTLESGSITMAKTAGKWNITAPIPAPANQQRVQLILDRLETLKAMGFHREKASEVKFGFDRPRGTVRLTKTGSEKPITLEIGADSPAGAVAFVRSSSANVVASVGASEVKVFLASPEGYYDPAIWVLPDSTEVKRVALKRPDGAVELTGAPGGRWRVTKPLDAPVDAENVNSILDRLDDLTATRIVSIGAKTRAYYARGARPVSATFAVGAPGTAASRPAGKTHTFNMAIINRKVYGWMTGDPIARVGLFSGRLYKQFSAEVRRREVLTFDPQSIDGITLVSGKSRMVLKRLDSGWKYPDDPALQIDQATVKGYLDRIRGVRAIRFVSHDETPADKFGLDKSKAWLVLELATKDGKTIQISVSRKGSDETANRYASVTGVRGTFTISAETAAGLARKIADFR